MQIHLLTLGVILLAALRGSDAFPSGPEPHHKFSHRLSLPISRETYEAIPDGIDDESLNPGLWARNSASLRAVRPNSEPNVPDDLPDH
ncbi:hypothetical protein Ciccas_010264 [Cichlidogyrus casuarinus]|uniref:Uncharacterized protein n=1 Tax=Cichlidogyrus casuarinus TaxID=1844966 RepID=A0ABD2PWJ7_9PLAT